MWRQFVWVLLHLQLWCLWKRTDMDNQSGPPIWYMELCSMWCGSLDGRRVWGENGHMYMYGWIPLLFTWNYHNIVNQQYPQYKIKFSKKGIGYLKGLSFKSGSNKRIHLQRRRPRFDPGLGRSPGERNDNPLQYSCSEKPMVWGAWWATVHWVTKSRTRLSN